MLLFTGTMGFLMVKFPRFHGIKVVFAVLFLLNSLFFLRFREKGSKGLWDRIMESKFFPRKLSFTNEGKFLVIISLGMGFAAVNTGSNLLYLLLAMLLSIITASGILSEISLQKVSWAGTVPPLAVRDEETVFPIRLENGKRHFSSFSLEGEVLFQKEPTVRQQAGAVLKLPALGRDTMFPRVVFQERGKCLVRAFSLSTRYPFSFFRKSRNFQVGGEVLVLPRGDRDVEGLLSAMSRGVDEQSRRAGRGSEFFSARQMQPGDEWRDVHWKQSARHGQFAVKEYEAQVSRRAYVRLVSKGGTLKKEIGEQAIELAASLVKRLSQQGWDVGLLTPETAVPHSSGDTAIRSCFIALALVDLDHTEGGQGEGVPAFTSAPGDLIINVGLDSLSVEIPGPDVTAWGGAR